MATGFGKLVLNRQQKREAKLLKKSVLQNFQDLEDPRVGRRRDHNLFAIPSHDTFGRVFGRLEPDQLEKGFQSWLKSITEKLGVELIQIDGKTLTGSYDREEKLKALHSVSAWSSEHNLVLAQQKVESKTNEIKAIPMLLNLLNLKGTVVTVDAMGTQIGIVKQIKNGGGDYVCGLKGEPSRPSLKQKRYRAALDNNLLLKILEVNRAS